MTYLRSHPVRRADETVGGAGDARRPEVRQLDVSHVCHQDVARLDIPEDKHNLNKRVSSKTNQLSILHYINFTILVITILSLLLKKKNYNPVSSKRILLFPYGITFSFKMS